MQLDIRKDGRQKTKNKMFQEVVSTNSKCVPKMNENRAMSGDAIIQNCL